MAENLEELVQLALAQLEAEEQAEALPVLQGTDSLELASDFTKETAKADETEEKQLDIRTQLSRMRVPQKMKAAMFGNAIVRRILITDPNRLIQECVLSNPQLRVPELEEWARNPNLDAQVLRSMTSRSSWMRSYRLKVNLVTNPKCPPDLSLKWLKFLNDTDVKQIAKSKNVPQVLQVAAKKKVAGG